MGYDLHIRVPKTGRKTMMSGSPSKSGYRWSTQTLNYQSIQSTVIAMPTGPAKVSMKTLGLAGLMGTSIPRIPMML